MASTLTSFRKTSLVSVLAVVSSFLLIAAQVFNCCRLNESISENVGKAARALGDLVSHPEVNPQYRTAKTHMGCHGHPPSGELQAETELPHLPDQTGSQLKAEESCLSESGLIFKALSPSIGIQTAFFIEAPVFLQEIEIPSLLRFEKPRPQNKSSPPIYLLTLRILV